MSHELYQTPNGHFAIIDDRSGNRALHAQPNARNLTTWHGVISQTSPGVIVGLGGDTGANLPGGAIPVALRYFGLKNAGVTSGTLTVGIDTTSTYFLNAQNVANQPTGQGQQEPVGVTNLFLALAQLPLGLNHNVTATYAESGTSGSGGPWYVAIDYYVPSPA